jgi:6,7-dimethyl-8-ribityllumazine synthase
MTSSSSHPSSSGALVRCGTLQSSALPAGARFAVVASRFNELMSKPLVEGAMDALRQCGLPPEAIETVWVPGAFELPLVCKKLAESKRFSGVIALGCVVKGATPHFDYVCSNAAAGIARVSYETGVPVIFGVLTTNTLEQATERSGTKAGNKGRDAAMAAVEMATLLLQL